MDKTPIYKESFEYAYNHGEEEQHIASNQANIACKKAIETAIASHYHDNRLNTQAAVQEQSAADAPKPPAKSRNKSQER